MTQPTALIDKAQWVSFDVFDTLLRRTTVHWSHVFGLIHDELAAHEWASRVDRATFTRLRMRAERLARRRRRLHHGTDEVNLVEIWEELAHSLPGCDLDLGMHTEIALESRVLIPRHPGVDLFHHARSRGKLILAISDMYHSAGIIGQWLDKNGIVPDHVFVSNEHGMSKRNGLIGHAATSLGLSVRKGLHIGDKDNIDGAGARRDGVKAYVMPHGSGDLLGPRQTIDAVLEPTESFLLQHCAHHWSDTRTDNLAFDLGYSHLGPAVAGMTAFARGTSRAHDIDLALFTSRDTRMMFELDSTQMIGPSYRSEYVNLSRQSLHIPALANGIDDDDLRLLTTGLWPTPIAHFLTRIGLDPHEHVATVRKHGFELDQVVVGKSVKPVVATMLKDLEVPIVELARTRLEDMRGYFTSLGLFDANRINLVELGWRGTIQNSLRRCLNALGWNGHLEGTYLALLWAAFPANNQPMNAWLTGFPRDTFFHDALAGGVPVIEAMFQANEQSVERYENNAPVLSGPILSRHVLDDLQSGARAYLSDHRALIAGLVDDGTPDKALARPLTRLITQPSREEALLLGSCEYSDGLGTTAAHRTILPVHLSRRQLRKQGPGIQWKAGLQAISR